MMSVRSKIRGALVLFLACLSQVPCEKLASADQIAKRKPASPKVVVGRNEEAPTEEARHDKVYQLLIHSTAYIEATAEDGSAWSGTGWIVDAPRRLMVTNVHVAAPDDAAEVKSLFAWFPVIKDGEPIHEVDYYLQNAARIPLTVLFTDATRDLAMVRAASLPEDAEPCPLADRSAPTGAHLHSLGGLPRGSQGLFIYTQGTARAVYQRTIATGGKIEVLETQMPLNQGNSGGPIVNDDGQVVGVFEGLNVEPGVQLVNMCIDIDEVRPFLDEAQPMIEPSSAADFNARGDHHYYAGRYRLALADFTQAAALEPQNAEAMSNLGWVHYQMGDAVTALATFEDALELDEKFVNALWGRGTVFRDQEKYAESIADLTLAIRLTTDTNELADLYNERGTTYYAEDDFKAAEADFRRALNKQPDHAWAHANSGDALAQLGRYDEALTSLQKALAIEPDNAQFWNIAGNVWFQRERYDLAVKMYSNAIDRDGSEGTYFRNRGSAYRLMERYADAIADLAKAVELSPEDAELWNELGLGWYDAGRFPEAVDAFSKAIELDGTVPVYFKNRGDAQQELGNHQQAVSDLTKAIDLEDDAGWHVLRGQSYEALGDNSRAASDFRRAAEMDSAYQMFDRKYIRVINDSPDEIKVNLLYHTKTTSGNWKWFPDQPGDGNSVTYTFAPGETGVLYHEAWKVNADRIRLWALSNNRTWFDYRDRDLVLASGDGYLSKDSEFATFSYTFR